MCICLFVVSLLFGRTGFENLDFETSHRRRDDGTVQVEVDQPVVDAKQDVDVGGVAGQQVPPAVQLRQGRQVKDTDHGKLVARCRPMWRRRRFGHRCYCWLGPQEILPDAGDLTAKVIVNVPKYESDCVAVLMKTEGSFFFQDAFLDFHFTAK